MSKYTKKDILKFYEMLPEPYRTQAINHYSDEWFGEQGMYLDSIMTLGDAINYGFYWDGTPEGDGYWSEVVLNANKFEKQWKREQILKML